MQVNLIISIVLQNTIISLLAKYIASRLNKDRMFIWNRPIRYIWCRCGTNQFTNLASNRFIKWQTFPSKHFFFWILQHEDEYIFHNSLHYLELALTSKRSCSITNSAGWYPCIMNHLDQRWATYARFLCGLPDLKREKKRGGHFHNMLINIICLSMEETPFSTQILHQMTPIFHYSPHPKTLFSQNWNVKFKIFRTLSIFS